MTPLKASNILRLMRARNHMEERFARIIAGRAVATRVGELMGVEDAGARFDADLAYINKRRRDVKAHNDERRETKSAYEASSTDSGKVIAQGKIQGLGRLPQLPPDKAADYNERVERRNERKRMRRDSSDGAE